jgi:hypothetical protein
MFEDVGIVTTGAREGITELGHLEGALVPTRSLPQRLASITSPIVLSAVHVSVAYTYEVMLI